MFHVRSHYISCNCTVYRVYCTMSYHSLVHLFSPNHSDPNFLLHSTYSQTFPAFILTLSTHLSLNTWMQQHNLAEKLQCAPFFFLMRFQVTESLWIVQLQPATVYLCFYFIYLFIFTHTRASDATLRLDTPVPAEAVLRSWSQSKHVLLKLVSQPSSQPASRDAVSRTDGRQTDKGCFPFVHSWC